MALQDKSILIKDVTLLAIDCTDRIRGTIEALNICVENIEFGDVVLLRHEKPNNLPSFITHREIKEIKNIDEYNSFVFLDLYKYFDTSHVLLCQDHAYILHPEVWDDGWLDWDYIGAPWPYQKDSYITDEGEHVRQGNGGFSLRSKKICELPSKIGLELEQRQGFYNEDGNCVVYHRKTMLENGIKYAPIEVASMFSYENLMQENYGVRPFGFHRNFPSWNQKK